MVANVLLMRQNLANMISGKKAKSSPYKGVDRHQNAWRASIRIQGKSKFLGYYEGEVEAALAYDRAAISEFKEFALINFPMSAADTVNRAIFGEPGLIREA